MDVHSAGTYAQEGGPATAGAVRAAAELGLDLSSHAAHGLIARDATAAELVIGMAVEHRDAIVDAAPEAAARTFTLKELARLANRFPPEPSVAVLAPAERLRRRVLAADRLRRDDLDPGDGYDGDDDVMDPLGMTLETYRVVAHEIDGLVEGVVGAIFGGPRVSAAGDATLEEGEP